jgi:ACS family D-galactonate transporter-like MFS transporter
VTPAEPGAQRAYAAPATASIGMARAWSVLGVLCLVYIAAWIDRINMSTAVADSGFKSLFQLDQIRTGWLNSAFFWTYAWLQIPAGWLVDRWGAKRSLTAGFVLWSLVAAGTGASSTLMQLIIMRLLLGVGEAVMTPAGMRWIRFNFPEQRRGTAIGIFMAAAKVGPAIGNFLAPLLLLALGWSKMFIILGLGSMIFVLPWWLMADDDRGREVKKAADAPPPTPWADILGSRVFWGTMIGTFAYQYFNYFCMTTMQKYFVEHRHFSKVDMGIVTGFSYTGFAAVAIGAGWWADHLIQKGADPVNTRRRFAMAGLLLASTELIGAFSPNPKVAVFFAIFSLCGLGLATANYWAVTQTLIPGAGVGRLVGIQNFAANIPGIVAPLLTGWLLKVTGDRYEAPMAVAAALLFIGIGSYRFLVRKEYAPRSV